MRRSIFFNKIETHRLTPTPLMGRQTKEKKIACVGVPNRERCRKNLGASPTSAMPYSCQESWNISATKRPRLPTSAAMTMACVRACVQKYCGLKTCIIFSTRGPASQVARFVTEMYFALDRDRRS